MRDKEIIHSLVGHDGWITSLAFSPNSEFLASGCEDGTIRLWDFRNGKTIYKSNTNIEGSSIAFSPDGRIMASSGIGIYLRRAINTSIFQKLDVGEEEEVVTQVVFCSNGKILAAVKRDNDLLQGADIDTIWLWSIS